MSLFPKKKADGTDAEETTPLFPKHGGPTSNYTITNGSDGGGVSELYDRSMCYKSLSKGELQITLGKPNVIVRQADAALADLINELFIHEHHYSHEHPRTNPQIPPEKRYKRHRNFWIFQLNQFRHWWKTSRLLVRLSGGSVYSADALNWTTMAMWKVDLPAHYKQAKHALKQMKSIGKGGAAKPFLEYVHPFTRTIRIVLAIARAWEARVDNRMYEVGLAEAFAFMGNRCSRYWTRWFVDWFTMNVMFRFSAWLFQSHIPQQSRPIIMLMGFLRAILPFAASFQGSRFGRQVTFNTYKYAFYRWKSTQSIMRFHEHTGVYQDTNLDKELLAMARQVAEAIGHGLDPTETRRQLTAIGYQLFAVGTSGYAVYRMKQGKKIILLHVTPYGPSILDEMPRFILLERRREFYIDRLSSKSDGIILDAATPREAKVRGFTYSGAFFQMQEWAALKVRYDRELVDYSTACHLMKTKALPRGKRYPQETHNPAPPNDLVSLKEFIRSGRLTFKQWKDNIKWNEIQGEVKKMAKLVARYQKQGKAPKRVILYLEGLDCAGKSSTGMLICQALEECGYSVGMAQHNRPPTPEQRAKPWMDRIRFEYPDDMYDDPNKVPEYASLVWDRGPAGDFVYGTLDKLPPEEKLKKYNEFRKYDYQCHQDGVLFFKLFFVSSKDAIAGTLGKRLAQKKISRDLRAWLDANSTPQERQGMEEIELHIDPTDFIAFNRYEENLSKFSEFARNTDYIGRVGGDEDLSKPVYPNPWLVINTTIRHSARLNMMKAFTAQLKRFAADGESKGIFDRIKSCCFKEKDQDTSHAVPSDIVEKAEHGLSFRAVFQSFVLFLLFYLYAYQTWNFKVDYIT